MCVTSVCVYVSSYKVELGPLFHYLNRSLMDPLNDITLSTIVLLRDGTLILMNEKTSQFCVISPNIYLVYL